jgi:hypothetical protein
MKLHHTHTTTLLFLRSCGKLQMTRLCNAELAISWPFRIQASEYILEVSRTNDSLFVNVGFCTCVLAVTLLAPHTYG